MLTSHHRKATPEDVRDSGRGPGAPVSRLLRSFLFLGCGGFGMVYLFTGSVIAAGLASGVLLALSAWSILAYHQKLSYLEHKLTEPEPVEVVEVRASRVLDVGAPGSTGPALCFEFPDGQVLLLFGQWLLEYDLYRAPRPAGDGNDARFNSLNDPFGFPSIHFCLHRWRGDTRPFWIEVRGAYLAPEPSSVQLPSHVPFKQVELFAGSMNTLQGDLEGISAHKD